MRRLAALMLAVAPSFAAEYFMYVGTYTRGAAKGIYAFRFDAATGKAASLGLAAETPNPAWLAVHPNGRFLYAANEHDGAQPGNAVSAFAVDAGSGKLTFLNKVSAKGPGPCHIALDKTGKSVLLANYAGGSIASLPVGPDGRLGEATAFVQHKGSSVNPQRQTAPHAHMIVPSPDNRFALVPDLGLDKILAYKLDPAKGTLTANEPATASTPGAGPRHLAFHPNGKMVYVINELDSTITAFEYSNGGAMKKLQTISTLPAGFTGQSSTAEIQIDKAGKFLYGSNRGHDSIAVFSIARNGALAPVEHVPTQGKTPRYFTLDPTGRFLLAANQASDTIVLFRVDEKTGKLTPTGDVVKDAPSPVAAAFIPVR